MEEETYEVSNVAWAKEPLQFQNDVLTLVMLNASRQFKNWRLSHDNQAAGYFDDIVLELDDGYSILINTKFSKTPIYKERLFSHLLKWFLSYQDIKTKFKVQNIIFCTNTSICISSLLFSTNQLLIQDSVLDYGDSMYMSVKFNENVLPYFKQLEGIRNRYKTFTDSEIMDFFEHLQIFPSYPSETTLQEYITKKLMGEISAQYICKKVEDWLKQSRGVYLSNVHVNAMFREIKSDEYCERLNSYNVLYKDTSLDIESHKKIIHIVANGQLLLQTLSIYKLLKDKQGKKLYVNLDEHTRGWKQTVEAFTLPAYVFLIFVCSNTIDKSVLFDIFSGLNDTLEKNAYKRVLFVTQDENESTIEEIGEKHGVLVLRCSPIVFGNVSKTSQDMLKDQANVVFQGKIVKLRELLEDQPMHESALNGVLEKLIKNEKIIVGIPIKDKLPIYYINRTLKRNISPMVKPHDGKNQIEEAFSEESLFDIDEKLILIADGPGMGKSTVLEKLAGLIKDRYPRLWVIKLELNNYIPILRAMVVKKKSSVEELLNSNDETKLNNSLEKFTFLMDRKVVLMLDGIDEISPDYTEIVISLLNQCLEAANFAKIFATTRRHTVQKLERILSVKSFYLQPFKYREQRNFLEKYWLQNLQSAMLNESIRQEWDRIFKMNLFKKGKNHFVATPLQIKMMAEVIQNLTDDWPQHIEFSFDNEEQQSTWKREGLSYKSIQSKEYILDKSNLIQLYDLFIHKKQDIFMLKGNPSGNPWGNIACTAEYHKCLPYHRGLALETVFGKTKCHLFKSYERCIADIEKSLLNIGIVQKSSGRLLFVHETFAYYFVADSLSIELKSQNLSKKFQSFFIDEVLIKRKHILTRAFLNSSLKNYVDNLSSNIFKQYKEGVEVACNHNLVHLIAEEGCIAILQLILKCIENSKSKMKFTDIRPKNTLNILTSHMEHNGINFLNENGNTPLHVASQAGQLDMVKFLLGQGANIFQENAKGQTSLHLAAQENEMDVIKFLLERDVDCNHEDNHGCTALHYAAEIGQLDIIKLLVDKKVDINIRNNDGRTALHIAVVTGHLKSIKFLMERGIDFKISDNKGNTALHIAAEKEQLKVVKLFLDLGVSVNLRNLYKNTVLHCAAESGDFAMVEFLVERGVEVDSKGNGDLTALQLAAKWGNLDVVEFLTKHVDDINSRDLRGKTALHHAVEWYKLDTVLFLVENKADINLIDYDQRTALHLAVMWGNLDAAKFLVNRGAQVNLKDRDGCTPLHLVAARGDLEIAELLVNRKADVNMTDNEGHSAMCLAALNNHSDVFKFLLKSSM